MLIIGHRGAGSYTPPNSRQSFSQAIAMGAQMIETDIRVTKDNIPIICHDATVDLGPIEELTWDQLKCYRLTNGELVPSLEEMLSLFSAKIRFNLEIKPMSLEKLEPVLHIVNKYHLHRPLYSSFSLSILRELSRHHGETALLLDEPLAPYEILDLLMESNATTLNLYYSLLNQDTTELLKKHHIKLISWTGFLDEIWDPLHLYQNAYHHNAYGFITGKPDRLKFFLNSK